MLNAELKIRSGKYQGKSIPLTTKRFLVGREQDCQLRPNSELVSRHHCVFLVDNYAVRLRDLGSTNGTRLNGQLVRGEVVLKPGDQITIGRLVVELLVHQTTPVPTNTPINLPVTPDIDTLSGTGTIEIPTLNPSPEADSNFEIPSMPPLPTAQADSNFEIPSNVPPLAEGAETMPTVTALSGDTAIIPGSAGAPMAPLAPYLPMQPPMNYPMGYGFPMPGQMPMYPPMPGYMPSPYPMQPGYPMAMPGMPAAPMVPQYPSARPRLRFLCLSLPVLPRARPWRKCRSNCRIPSRPASKRPRLRRCSAGGKPACQDGKSFVVRR
ncbi:MAG: FHA domain-containing protein [Planctomycetaceae bacterium]